MPARACISSGAALVALGLSLGASPAFAAAGGAAARGREVAEVGIETARAPVRAGEEVDVTIVLRDVRGSPVDAPDVALESVGGQVAPLRRVREGVHRTTLSVPQVLGNPLPILLFASAGAAHAEHVLALAPGPAAAMEVTGPSAAPASGSSHVLLGLSVTDAFGNPADEEPHAHAGAGALPVRRIGRGNWLVEYLPLPLRGEDADDVIVLEAGAVRRTHAVRVTASERWMAFMPWAGAAAMGAGRTVAVGASASGWWRLDRDQVGLVLDAGWWRLRDRDALALPTGVADLTGERRFAPVTAAFAWGHRLGQRLSGTLSAGAGVALVSASERLAGQAAARESRWGPAAIAATALGYRIGRGVGMLEVRGVWIGDPGLMIAPGPARALLIVGGYRLDAR